MLILPENGEEYRHYFFSVSILGLSNGANPLYAHLGKEIPKVLSSNTYILSCKHNG